MARGKPKTRVGVVSGAGMNKTVTVDVIRIVEHGAYSKPVKRTSRFKAHDERNECSVGDKVLIIQSRPLSRTKSWRVSRVLEKSRAPEELLEGGA